MYKKIVNKVNKILLITGSMLFFVGGLITPVLSEEGVSNNINFIASTTIPIENIGSNEENTKYTYEIKFVDGDSTSNLNGTENNQYIEESTIELLVGQTGQFQLDFLYPANYSYEIRQTTKSPDGNYENYKKGDETVYVVDVSVLTDGNGGYTTETCLYEENGTTKMESAKFYNIKTLYPEVTPQPTTTPNETINNKTTTANTSDTSNIYVWGGLVVLGLIGVITVLVIRNRASRKGDR